MSSFCLVLVGKEAPRFSWIVLQASIRDGHAIGLIIFIYYESLRLWEYHDSTCTSLRKFAATGTQTSVNRGSRNGRPYGRLFPERQRHSAS